MVKKQKTVKKKVLKTTKKTVPEEVFDLGMFGKWTKKEAQTDYYNPNSVLQWEFSKRRPKEPSMKRVCKTYNFFGVKLLRLPKHEGINIFQSYIMNMILYNEELNKYLADKRKVDELIA